MHFFRAILIGLLALIATGCGKGGVQSPDFTPVLQSLSVTPATATVAAGLTQQFTVVGVYSVPPGSDADSDPRPIENVEWSSSDTTRATVDADGLVTAISAGAVTITASADGVEGTALLTVGAPQLQSLTITPATSTVAVDSSTQLTANGVFSDGSTAPVSATWTSSNTTFVTVTAGPATTTSATGVSVGTSTITATADGGLTATATVAVRARVVSITIVPDTGTSPAGRPFQYSATGTIKTGPATNTTGNTTDGSLAGVVWSIANAVGDTNPAQVANIDAAQGIATGLRAGNAVVTATVDGATDTAAFVVTPAVLDRITISPANPSLALGATATLTANGVLTDGRLQQVPVTWSLQSSSVPGIVTFDPNPAAVTQITGAVVGTGTILATAVSDTSITGTTGVTVTNAVLQAIVGINPPVASVNPGRSIEFTLQGRFSDNVVRDIDDATVTWTSGTPAVATIDANGVATGVSEGQTIITATSSAVTGTATATLTVTNSQCTTPLVASNGAQVTPLMSGLCIGCSVLNSAAIIDASDTTFGTLFAPVGVSNQATISALVEPGANTPTFAAGNNAGFLIGAPVGILGASVAQRVQVSTTLNGVPRETSGDLIPLRVEALGQLVLPGGVPSENYLVSIQASLPYDGIMITSISGVAQVLSDVQVFQACGTVTPAVQPTLVGLSRIEPIAPTVVVGQGRNLVAYGTLSNGTEVEIADADLNWTTNAQATATVDANGLVTAVTPGLATITATLKSTVVSSGSVRSAVSNVTVISGACTTPFLASSNPLVAGATASGAPFGICLFCNVANTPNAIDGQLLSAATVSVPVALLSPVVPSGASLSVLGPVGAPTIQPPAGGQFTGFVVGRPLNPLLQAELLDSIQVSTLRRTLAGPVVVETTTSGTQTPLRLGLLGLELVGENELVLAGIRATQPYDGIRVTFNAGLATALSNFLVYESCAAAVEPTAGDQ